MPQYDRKTTLLSDNDIDMSLPINIDEYSRLVVLDDNELQQQNVAVSIRERLQRLRGIYAYWLQFPSKFDQGSGIRRLAPHPDTHGKSATGIQGIHAMENQP